MSDDGVRPEAARAYAAAYAAHYSERDNTRVPPRELLDAQLELALAHLERS